MNVAAGPKKPNILFIVVDNWGWGDLGVQGSTIPTPRIDSLADEGLRLTNYNVESQCMPTRAAIHSARLPIRSGTAKNDWSASTEGLAPWEYTIAELFSEAGYATALYGKWHIGASEGRYPTDQGYDEWFGIVRSTNEAAYTSAHGFDPGTLTVFKEAPALFESQKNSKPERVLPYDMATRGQIDEMLFGRAVDFVKKRTEDKQAFFLMVSTTALHPPLVANPAVQGKSGAGNFPDMLMELDHNIGSVLDALDENKLSEDTIVILSGENGAMHEWGAGSNGPWRGGLGTGYEGGFRSPAMIRWPGHIERGVVSDEIVASLDWMPTLAEIIGRTDLIPADRPIDGVDQSPFFLGKQLNSNREHVLVFIGDELFAGKWRNFKMHFITREGRIAPNVRWSVPLLYNIKADPGEIRELNQTEEVGQYIWAAAELLQDVKRTKESFKAYPNIAPGAAFNGY